MRSGTPLNTVTGAIRHFWWIALLLTVGGVGGALVAAQLRPPTYQATAVLDLDTTQNAGQGFDVALQADQFLSQRYIQMATSRIVLDQVCAASTPRCDPTSLAQEVSASDSKATGMIQISATASSATEAAQLANGVAAQVLAQNSRQIDDRIKPQRDALQATLAQQSTRLHQIRDQLALAKKSSTSDTAVTNAIAPLLADLSQAQTQYNATQTQLQTLQLQQAQLEHTLSPLQVAMPPSKPIDPNPVLYALVGLAAGLIVGFLAALLAERLDDRIRDSGQLAEATGSPLVLEAGVGGRNGAVDRQAASFSLAYASMLARHDSVRAVLVVAATYGDQADQVGVGLATAAAQWGRRVLVIQSYPADHGSGHSPAGEVTSQVVVEAASSQPNGQEVVAADGFDLIIACTPPPGYSSNAMSFMSSTDMAIVVATRRQSRSRDARWAAELLRHTGVRIAGAVLVDRKGRGLKRPAHLAPC
ncbi:MAG: Wzz/FepE/Etk N-terminal domain-containing protein [Actinomycetota bacterium]|nr:Wzz/FepE/Etk N-terminal domain-containing protein [Actinomycetota bacterium]